MGGNLFKNSCSLTRQSLSDRVWRTLGQWAQVERTRLNWLYSWRTGRFAENTCNSQMWIYCNNCDKSSKITLIETHCMRLPARPCWDWIQIDCLMVTFMAGFSDGVGILDKLWKKVINHNIQYVITILKMLQNIKGRKKIVSWVKHCNNIVWWGVWWFLPVSYGTSSHIRLGDSLFLRLN